MKEFFTRSGAHRWLLALAVLAAAVLMSLLQSRFSISGEIVGTAWGLAVAVIKSFFSAHDSASIGAEIESNTAPAKET